MDFILFMSSCALSDDTKRLVTAGTNDTQYLYQGSQPYECEVCYTASILTIMLLSAPTPYKAYASFVTKIRLHVHPSVYVVGIDIF